MSRKGSNKDSDTVSLEYNIESIDIKLLPAESVICSDKDVIYLGPHGKIPGNIVVTKYRICFMVEEANQKFENFKLDIPLGHISKVEKIGRKTTSSGPEEYGFSIHCKDLRFFRFSNAPKRLGRKHICDALNRYAFPISNYLPLFAFLHAAEAPKPAINGWEVFSIEKEFKRLGIVESKLWTIMENNLTYRFCDTYPRKFAIPTASATKGNNFLAKLADYRSRKRIPVLSWIDKSTNASITRCSQPMTGMINRKCAEDEEHLSNIMLANGNCHMLLIYDARPIVNAKVNKAKGGGYEEGYEYARLEFLDIQNIHVVRDSLKRLMSCLIPCVDQRNYFKIVEESKWLDHIKTILDGSLKIVHNVSTSMQSVLVHCSDGWDRTAQLTSMAMIQLDGYYRTFEGFCVLIEKEWCSFGHKFGQRCGHGEDKASDGERSPIFVQFIDCVWQLMRQYPTAFEFTAPMLVLILDELFSCRFGTFLFNSEKSRMVENQCEEKTHSLWSLVLENRRSFKNHLYKKEKTPILVSTIQCNLDVWIMYYGRWNPNVITPKKRDVQQFATQVPSDKVELLEDLEALNNIPMEE